MVLSQIGLILLLMFQIGSEFEFGHLREAREQAGGASVVAVSSVSARRSSIGFLLGMDHRAHPGARVSMRSTYSLFVSVALGDHRGPDPRPHPARSIPLTRADIGVIAITAAAANDVVGWFLRWPASPPTPRRRSRWPSSRFRSEG